VPPEVRKPDSFYNQVAEVFGAAAAESDNPAARVAEVNGLEVAKVYQWVKEARRRGLLPPATRNARPTPAPMPSPMALPSTRSGASGRKRLSGEANSKEGAITKKKGRKR
jgi:hypothetical protein